MDLESFKNQFLFEATKTAIEKLFTFDNSELKSLEYLIF